MSASPILAEQAAHSAFSAWYAACHTGESIRTAREDAGLSREAVARYALMSPTTLARIEHGKRRVLAHEMPALARALGVSLTYLAVATNGNGRAA